MTNYTFAQLDRWAAKSQKRMDVVTRQATGDLIGGIRIAPGITRAGSRQKGTIPRHLGTLAGSLTSSLYGSSSITSTGAESHVLIAGGMRAGDVATFSWGGPLAPYARPVHDGARGVPGTHWIDEAAPKWPGYVASAVSRAIARVP